MATTILDELQE